MVLSRQSVKGLPLCFNSFRELFHFSLVLFPFPLKTMCWEYLSFFSLATPCGIWDLSSLTRDWTHTFWIRRQSFNHFLKVFNYIIVLESFFTSFSWILKLRGIFLQSHIVRFSWQSSKALFLFVGSQKSSLKHGSLLSCPTFLHDLQWWLLCFFFCKKWYPTTHSVWQVHPRWISRCWFPSSLWLQQQKQIMKVMVVWWSPELRGLCSVHLLLPVRGRRCNKTPDQHKEWSACTKVSRL